MCNDNLSGIAVATALARILALNSHRYTYRFLFVPGTIGPIAWLSRNQDKVSRIKHGLVLACVGDRGCVNYKRSRRHTADIDRAVEHVLQTRGAPFEVRDFSPYGYDERQFCSPGFNLPMGSFRRTPHGEYPEYHTSADDLNYVSPTHLANSLGTLLEVIDLLEGDVKFLNLVLWGSHNWDGGDFCRQPARGNRWRCCGCSIFRTARTVFSILPSALAYPSKSFVVPLSSSSSATC